MGALAPQARAPPRRHGRAVPPGSTAVPGRRVLRGGVLVDCFFKKIILVRGEVDALVAAIACFISFRVFFFLPPPKIAFCSQPEASVAKWHPPHGDFFSPL